MLRQKTQPDISSEHLVALIQTLTMVQVGFMFGICFANNNDFES